MYVCVYVWGFCRQCSKKSDSHSNLLYIANRPMSWLLGEIEFG